MNRLCPCEQLSSERLLGLEMLVSYCRAEFDDFFCYSSLLPCRQLREHWQRDNFRGGFFGHREISYAVIQRLVGLLQVQAESDSGFRCRCLPSSRCSISPSRSARSNHIQVIHRSRPRRLVGWDHSRFCGFQQTLVFRRTLASLRVPLWPDAPASRAEDRPESRPAGRCSLRCRDSTLWPGRDRGASSCVFAMPASFVVTAPASPHAPRFFPG